MNGGAAGVLTFDPYPLRVLAPDKAPKRLLASLDHKAEILAALGIDFLLVLRFDRERATQEPEDFVREICAAGVKTIAVGEDWRFGRARRGDTRLLGEMGASLDLHLEAAPPVMLDGERISSTRIRQAIRDGRMDVAAKMLGRPYTVEGRVVEGRKLGRQLGFPTANMETGEEQLPSDGVWVVRARVGEERLGGVANLGVRPTVDGMNRSLEVHLFNFAGDIYGRVIEVEFTHFLRGERRFDSLDELKAAILADAAHARDWLLQATE